ncbi:hypothetical protein ACLESD_27810 [Pyxidicoccus sp. 3LFB2]
MVDLPIEERITQRIQSFDLPALMDLLAKEGYGEGHIELRSHRGTVHVSNLVHAIEFLTGPRRAIVTLNLGLLSVQTPLPSFFLKLMEELKHEALESFLGYFDHLLLSARVAGLFPERDTSLLPGWEGTPGTGWACCAPPAPAPSTGSSPAPSPSLRCG